MKIVKMKNKLNVFWVKLKNVMKFNYVEELEVVQIIFIE